MKGVRKYMMKYLVPLLVLSSCNSFLDEEPDNRVAVDDLEKAAQLLTNGYSIASPNFTDWMSDDAVFTIGTQIRLAQGQLFAWQDVTTDPTELDTPDFYWFETYNAIAHANEVLAILDDLPVNSPEDLAFKDAIEAEALLIRAYGHFMLVNLFSLDFSNTSGGDDGIPYIKTPETAFLASYERESIRSVYRDIEDDLLDGLEKVDDSFFENSGKYHFNRNAALAFATRFYLFTRDYPRCVLYANQLLGNNPSAFIRDMTSEEFQLASASIPDYPRLYGSPDLPSNLLLMRKVSLVQRTDFAFGVEQNFYRDLFGTSVFGGLTDEREDPALVKGQNAVYPLRYQSLFERSSLNSNVGTPYYIHIALTGEEAVLNRAEANAFLGNFDAALSDIQALAERRYSGGTPNLTLTALQDFYGSTDDLNNILSYLVFVERRKEFIMQGMRWFDLRRFNLSVSRTFFDGSVDVLQANDLRKVLQIPRSAIDVGGLEPNPR